MKSVFPFDSTTIPLWCYVLMLVINIGVFMYWALLKRKELSRPIGIKDYGMLFFFIVFVLFYCLVDDYFTYRSWVEDGYSIYYDKELIYTFLIDFVNSINTKYNYEAFRLMIWGTAIILFFITSQIIKERPLITMLFLFLLFYNTFSYARGTLGMAIYSLGVVLLIKGKQKTPYFLLGAIVVLLSFVFHRQMLIAIAITPIMFLPLNSRKSILLSIPLVLIVAFSFNYFTGHLGLFDASIANNLESYSSLESAGLTVNRFIEFSLFYIGFFLAYRQVSKLKLNSETIPVIYLFRITYGLIAAATALLIVLSNDNTIFYRTLYMSMIPLTLVLSFLYINGHISKKTCSLYFLYAMLYHSIALIVRLR